MDNDNEVKLTIMGLVYNQSIVNTYGLVLQEEDGNRRFSVMIGEPEAQSIALKMNNKVLARPLTHDLINNILHTLGANLKKILIYDLVNEIFYSELYIEDGNGNILKVEARTSDAVALAVRTNSPIYIKKEILDIVGTKIVSISEDEKKNYDFESLESMTSNELDLFLKEELEEFLERAVEEEKYELAVRLRNAIENKNDKNT